MAVIHQTTKEIGTGTSTAAFVEAVLHGFHGFLIVVIVGGYIIAIYAHFKELSHNEKNNKRGVRNYGLIRLL